MTWRFALSTLIFLAAASPALAQEIDCLFLSPVPVEELPPGFIGADEVCLERERFEFDGRQFIFADIVGYDRSYADRQFALTREVIERSLPLYRTWFQIPDALFLFGRAPGAAAQAETGGAREACVVRVDDVALRQGIAGDSDDDQFRRAMAHELFHCVQTFDPTLDNEYVRWRDEGTAEYFAGLAIPESLPGPQLYADFDALIGDTPLYDLGFHAYPFFAFLGGDGGVGAVVDFLRAGRANPDEAGTLTHLSSYPGMDDLFHRFARRWAEGRLLDDQGRPLPLGGFSGGRLLVERETTIEADLKPFTIFTQALSLSSGLAWNFPAPDYSGRASLAEAPGAWRDLETSVDTCRAERDATLLATSTANSAEVEIVTFTIAERPDLARDCPCPIGSWILAGDALAATGFGSTGTGIFESGSLVLKFDDGGQATAIFNDITYFTDGAVKLRTILGGQLHWTWRKLPFAAAKLGPAPSGTGLEALAIERSLTTADAHWRVQFINDEGAVVGEKATEVKPDQWGGGKNLVGAICQGGELLLADDAASLVPGNIGAPPYSGAYQRF